MAWGWKRPASRKAGKETSNGRTAGNKISRVISDGWQPGSLLKGTPQLGRLKPQVSFTDMFIFQHITSIPA